MKHSGLLAKAVQRFGSPTAEGNPQRILDAALKQFELFGIRRSTVEDITKRSGLARVTLTTMREHALLQRLLATEPETVLPFLTVEGDSVIQTASSFLAHQLAVALPDDRRTQIELLEVAEVTVRVIVSFVLTPSQNVALGDDDAARSFARRYLVPPPLGLTG